MRLMEFDYNYKTKSGNPIEFKIHEDIEGDNNRGFIVDQIDAWVDGKHAGYLKLSWIPQDRFDAWYPTIFHFISNIQGTSLIPYDNPKAAISKLSDKELDRIIEYSLSRTPLKFGKGKRAIADQNFINNLLDNASSWSATIKPDTTKSDKVTAISIIEKLLLKSKIGQEFANFYDRHVDKPKVDYIKVFNGNDINRNKKDENTENWSRQRIGTALYIKGAKYLKNKGLKLHASGLQSDEAQAAWVNLEKMGIVQPGDRRTINASR